MQGPFGICYIYIYVCVYIYNVLLKSNQMKSVFFFIQYTSFFELSAWPEWPRCVLGVRFSCDFAIGRIYVYIGR